MILPETKKKEGEIFFSPSFSSDESSIDIENLWKKVFNSIENILHSRFSNVQKRKINYHNDRIAFACPYCGDSQKIVSKKRANLFFDTMHFHCFNGDCNIHKSIINFLVEHEKIRDYTKEEIDYFRNHLVESKEKHSYKKHEIQSIESLFSQQALDTAIPRKDFMNFFKLQEIHKSRIQRYLLERFQTQNERFAFDPKKGQIYIFNLSKDNQKIFGFQIKTFNKKAPYLTYKMSKMYQMCGLYSEEKQKILDKVDSISTVFGIMHIDLDKTITVFEGPFDSFLFPNAVGVCSANNDFPFEIEGLRYFYDNDITGKKRAMEKIQAGYSVFLWQKFLHENELSIFSSKIKDLTDLRIFLSRNKIKTTSLATAFSIDKYDAIYL